MKDLNHVVVKKSEFQHSTKSKLNIVFIQEHFAEKKFQEIVENL